MSKKIGLDVDIAGPVRSDRCIRTSSGVYIDVFDPDPDTILIEDIAHSLSHQCRYGGHLPVFYSVCQHSIWCCDHVEGEDNKLAALLHDASEAYLLDMPRPIKYQIPQYKEIEDKLMRAIALKFGFEYPLSPEVKIVDDLALHYEWDIFFESKVYLKMAPMPQENQKFMFLQKFKLYNRL